jgi:hypothetical protein
MATLFAIGATKLVQLLWYHLGYHDCADYQDYVTSVNVWVSHLNISKPKKFLLSVSEN